MSDDLAVLQQWATQGLLKKVELSSDGASLTLNDTTLDGTKQCQVSYQSKSCQYTLASLFLQILDPDQGLLPYRNSCKAHGVNDPVKVLDKPIVVGHLLGASSSNSIVADEQEEQAKEQETVKKQSSKSHRDDHDRPRKRKEDHRKKRKSSSSHDKRKKHRDSSDHYAPSTSREKKKKTPKAPMTDEQLFSNLNVVADKRMTTGHDDDDDDGAQQEEALKLKQALSANGFVISKEMVEQFKDETEQIQSMEVPVGNSASILRSSQQDRDFAQVLELYLQTIKQPSQKDSLKQKQSPQQKSSTKSYLVGKKPIIVVPKGMTSPITLVNAHEFLANAKFVPRDLQLKRVASGQAPSASTTFTRKVGSRLGGGTVEYEIMDNPKSKLGENPKEWQRVVAVIALGASWQFKDWFKDRQYSSPVNLFSKTFGFYIGMEGDPIPQELLGWNVKRGKLNRDKRGLDSVTYASFWNGLDEWMAVHKRELLPQSEA